MSYWLHYIQCKGCLHNHQGGQRWYFYVPKGMKAVHYFPGNDSYTHQVLGPKHEVIATVQADGKIKRIPVPDGVDGAQWSLGGPNGFQPGEFWFYNLPNWLSSAPNALLVPREVAVKDGLKIRH